MLAFFKILVSSILKNIKHLTDKHLDRNLQIMSNREQTIIRTSWAGVGINLLLSGFKAVVGLLSHSIAILLDAVNNLTDAFSATVTIIGMKLAIKPADKEHPFGHGRAEYFTAVVISVIIIVAGGSSFIESFKKIMHPEQSDYSLPMLAVLVVAILVKILLGHFVKRIGHKVNSESLMATGADALFDALVTGATFIAAVCSMLFGDKLANVPVDGILGCLISLIIIKAGYTMLMSPVNELMGERIPAGLAKAIKADICRISPVLGAYDLQLHNYGPKQMIGAVNVALPEEMTAEQIHFLSQRIRREIYAKYSVLLTVGIYAVITGNKEIVQMQDAISSIAMSYPGVLQVHGMFVDTAERHISFDIVLDFSVRDIPALKQNITDSILSRWPGYSVQINVDKDWCD